jgi:hypothetical protein
MALLQLGDARGHGQLLEHRLHADLLGDGAGEVDLVADDLARLRVDEAVGLVGAEHAEDDLAFFLMSSSWSAWAARAATPPA